MASLLSASGLGGLESSLGVDSLWTPTQTVLKNNATYDYIVVGGGTAGCTVSSRLVENSNNDVLLLEAGPDPLIATYFAGIFFLLQGSINDYNYTSTLDSFAARGAGNYTQLTAGNTLGGSSAINHLLFTRGSSKDFDYWSELTDDDSWKYANILKYFIKSENVNDKPIVEAYSEYHGTSGPIGLTTERRSQLNDYFKAFAEVGNPERLDINSNIEVGYVQPLYTINNGRRQTTQSYIYNVKSFSNFHYSKETKVARVIFEGNKAVAVEAYKDGVRYTLKAKKEIILSAGVYNTPQILQLSGIGPKSHLESLGITVKADLAVGDNFIDQVATHIAYKTNKYLLPIISTEILAALNPTQVGFPIMVGAVALNKSQTINPDYQTFCLFLPHDTPFLTIVCSTVFGLLKEKCSKLQKEVAARDTLYCLVTNIKPDSRGTIRIKSTDPYEDPAITTNYYKNATDRENMLLFIKDFLTVGNSSVFTQIGAELAGLDIGPCKDKVVGSNEYWECHYLNWSTSVYHGIGSCAMGSVVDGKLKVKGFDNIRIVDASVIPRISGAPNAAVIMLSEKAADMIQNDG